MLYFIITIVALVTILLYQYVALRSMYYSTVAQCKFRQLRFNATIYLSETVKSGSSLEDIEEHYEFLGVTNHIIKNFESFLPVFAKLKFVKHLYISILISTRKLEVLKKEKSDTLSPYKLEFLEATRSLFKAIPFWHVRIIIHVFETFLQFATRLGFHQMESTLSKLKKLTTAEKELNNGCFT